MPGRATTVWWKEERIGVFFDYNQNARDRTVASQYSVRAMPDAKVSCPLRWPEVTARLDPRRFTIRTVPPRLEKSGDPIAPVLGEGIDIAGALARLDRAR